MGDSVLGLDGKTVVITGGMQGIGLGCAELFADAGANVVIADLRADDDGSICGQLTRRGVRAVSTAADVRRQEDLERIVEVARAEFGGIDIAVNNAGGDMGYVNPKGAMHVFEITRDYFDAVIDLNLKATFFACQVFAKAMIDTGTAGSIVNISSFQGHRAAPGLPIYGAAKAAIAHLTQTMAYELGPYGLRVNCVAPAHIESPRTALLPEGRRQAAADAMPIGRTGTARDLAAAVVFLASPLASYYTGHHIIADGGLSLTSARPPILWTEYGKTPYLDNAATAH